MTTRQLIAITALSLLAATAAPASATDPPCDRVASLQGDDAAAGTPAAPVRTIRRLMALTGAGQTACLTAGQTFHEIVTISRSGTDGAPVRLTSTTGGRATITGQIRFTGSHLRIERVDFGGLAAVGDTYPKTYHLGVDGDDVRIADADITSPRGICVDVGQIDAYGGVPGARADSFVLERVRVHGCGLRNLADGQLTRSDSGVHGIYLKHTDGARISDSVVFDNANRGIQLWPAATNTVIERNVLDGNGSNLNLGSYAPNGFYSSGTTVRGNVISNSALRSCETCDAPPGDTAQVHGNFPAGEGDFGNVVEGNCVFQADPARNFDGYGYRVGTNVTGDPRYVDRAAKDFRLADGSPCHAMGPRSAAPAQPVEVVAQPVAPGVVTGDGGAGHEQAATPDPGEPDPVSTEETDEDAEPVARPRRGSLRLLSLRFDRRGATVRVRVPAAGTVRVAARRGGRRVRLVTRAVHSAGHLTVRLPGVRRARGLRVVAEHCGS